METRDEFYMYQATLNSLLLLKVAYNAGVDMSIFRAYQVSIDFGVDPLWDNFLSSISYLFEEWDILQPYDTKSNKEKEYWFELAGYKRDYLDTNSVGVLVVMDDRIQPFTTYSFGGYSNEVWYTGYGELHGIDHGVVIIFDDEEGPIDWTDVLYLLTEKIQMTPTHKESEKNEMAV